MISLEKAPQNNPDNPELVDAEPTAEERVAEIKDELLKSVELGTEELDAKLVEDWDQRSEAENPAAIRLKASNARMDLEAIDYAHSNNRRPSQSLLPKELADKLVEEDARVNSIEQRLGENEQARTTREAWLKKAGKKRKVINFLTLGIGAGKRNKKHADSIRSVHEYHDQVGRNLHDSRHSTRAKQAGMIDQHREALWATVESADIRASTQQEMVDQADNDLEAAVVRMEELARQSIGNSYKSYGEKEKEVLGLLTDSSVYQDADPARRAQLEARCSKVLRDALIAEQSASQAAIGSHLVATVKERFTKGPAGGRLDIENYLMRANLQAGGHWDEARVESLAKELVKFGMTDGRSLSNVSPELIIDMAAKELDQAHSKDV